MKRSYDYYSGSAITKQLLDGIKRGDLVKCNDWKMPLRVLATSENYIFMNRPAFGKILYSVCEKKKDCDNGSFWIGCDNLIFGYSGGYDFRTENEVMDYLAEFESGSIEHSKRCSTYLIKIYINRCANGIKNT